MKKKTKELIVEDPELPQKSLEQILKTEIKIAQELSEAKEKAEKSVRAARDEIAALKNKIVEKSRADRDQMLAEGVEQANKKALEILTDADQQSKLFYKSGETFIDSAVQEVIKVVLDSEDRIL